MRKKIFNTACLFLLFSLSAIIANGQYILHYCPGCVNNGLCPDTKEFSSCEAAQNAGKVNCPGGGWWVTGPDCGGGGPVGFVKSPIRNGIPGAIIGGLIGSFKKDASGESQWLAGSLAGFAGTATITLLATSKNRSRGENILIAVLAGGTGGASVGMFQKANATVESPKPDNTLKYAAYGALGVGLVGAVLPNEGKSKSHKSSSINKNGKATLLSKISVKVYGDRIGLVLGL